MVLMQNTGHHRWTEILKISRICQKFIYIWRTNWLHTAALANERLHCLVFYHKSFLRAKHLNSSCSMNLCLVLPSGGFRSLDIFPIWLLPLTFILSIHLYWKYSMNIPLQWRDCFEGVVQSIREKSYSAFFVSSE